MYIPLWKINSENLQYQTQETPVQITNKQKKNLSKFSVASIASGKVRLGLYVNRILLAVDLGSVHRMARVQS